MIHISDELRFSSNHINRLYIYFILYIYFNLFKALEKILKEESSDKIKIVDWVNCYDQNIENAYHF